MASSATYEHENTPTEDPADLHQESDEESVDSEPVPIAIISCQLTPMAIDCINRVCHPDGLFVVSAPPFNVAAHKERANALILKGASMMNVPARMRKEQILEPALKLCDSLRAAGFKMPQREISTFIQSKLSRARRSMRDMVYDAVTKGLITSVQSDAFLALETFVEEAEKLPANTTLAEWYSFVRRHIRPSNLVAGWNNPTDAEFIAAFEAHPVDFGVDAPRGLRSMFGIDAEAYKTLADMDVTYKGETTKPFLHNIMRWIGNAVQLHGYSTSIADVLNAVAGLLRHAHIEPTTEAIIRFIESIADDNIAHAPWYPRIAMIDTIIIDAEHDDLVMLALLLKIRGAARVSPYSTQKLPELKLVVQLPTHIETTNADGTKTSEPFDTTELQNKFTRLYPRTTFLRDPDSKNAPALQSQLCC